MKEKKLDIPESIASSKPTPRTVYPPNKTQKKSSGFAGFLIFLIIIIALGYSGYRIYLLIQYKPQITEEKIELQDTEELQKIQTTTQFTNPISISEPSGRADPLAPF